MKRELKNGDLVLVKNDSLADHLIDYKVGGMLGVVVDDIDAHEEVMCYHTSSKASLSFRWWSIESLELISEGR